MSGSYRQCRECGKRALSIATRCPGCGRELPTPAGPDGPALDLRRFLSPRVLGGIIAVIAVLIAAALARSRRPLEQQSSLAVAASALSAGVYITTTGTRLDTVTAAPLATASAGEVLVARTWTNVRKSRSKRADVEAVLLPGDTVLADSLDRGWYRVALEGEVLGYVHRSTLARP
jgi:HAMP domain-containing protein